MLCPGSERETTELQGREKMKQIAKDEQLPELSAENPGTQTQSSGFVITKRSDK